MKKLFAFMPASALFILPFMVSAQGFGEVDTFVTDTSGLINGTLIPILLAVAFLVFIVGAVRFFLLAGDDYDDNKKKGKSLMLYGIIGFVLIVSIWGIVALISNGLGFDDNDQLRKVPTAPIDRSAG